MFSKRYSLSVLCLVLVAAALAVSAQEEDARARDFYAKSDDVRAAAVQLDQKLGTVRGTREARRAAAQVRRRVDELQQKAAHRGVRPEDYRTVRNAAREALCAIPEKARDGADGEAARLIEAVDALINSNPGGEEEARAPTFQWVCP